MTLFHSATTDKKSLYIRLSGMLLVVALLFPLSSCCNDAFVQEVLEDTTMHEQGLRDADEQESIIYIYRYYNSVLNNTMSLCGHFWDKQMSELSFALLVAVMLIIKMLVKRVHFLYRFFDGEADILLNTTCAVALSLNVLSFFDMPLATYWFIPAVLVVCGLSAAVLSFRYPFNIGWLTSGWLKYVRWLYVALYAVFVVMCLTNAKVFAPSVY